MSSIAAVDLFCGAGGLTNGLQKAGIRVAAGYDINPLCAFPYSYNNNTKFINKSIEEISSEEIGDLLSGSEIKAVVGCAPCQPFSTYSRKHAKHKQEYKKWCLLDEFLRIIEGVNPEIISMENVLQLRERDIYKRFLAKLDSLGYIVSAYDVDCREYGVPQSRKRLVLFGSRFGSVQLSPPCHRPENYVTVRDAIYDLEKLSAGDVSDHDSLHKCSKLSELNLKRIRASKPGGSWRGWDKSILAGCHTKEAGKSYSSVYGRMEWDKPSPTITTQCFGFGNGRFGHPEQDRAISLREAALLQTFPRDYKFVQEGETIVFKHVGRLIGNAVPVRLGEVVGGSIMSHANQV